METMRLLLLLLSLPALLAAQLNPSWLARYSSLNRNDEAWHVAAGPDGGVFIAGWSYGGQADFLLARYDSAGSRLWAQRYGGPNHDYVYGLAVDDSGRAVVAGARFTGPNNYDYYLRRHRADGSEDWSRLYSGPAGRHDIPAGVALDQAGNVYVTGMSQSGRGNRDYDCVTVKYSPTGTLLWTHTFNRRDSVDDAGAAVAVAADGHIWVCGTSGNELLVLRLRPNGDTAWARSWLSGSRSQGVALRLDRTGGAVLLGTAQPGGNQDFALLRYDSLGNRTWAQTWDGPGRGFDTPGGLALDGQDNVYLCGGACRTTTDVAYATLKYSPAGVRQWVAWHNSPDTTGADFALAIAADAAGNSYVTGRSWSPAGNYWDIVTVKYDPDGTEQWVDRYDGAGAHHDEGRAATLGRDGNVYIAGFARNEEQDSDAVIIRLAPGGTRRWVREYAGPGGTAESYDCGRYIGRDAAGNIYVTGRYNHGTIGTVKYSMHGVAQWLRVLGWGRNADEPKGMHVTAAGDLYVLAKQYKRAWCWSLVKYNSAGAVLWARDYAGPDSAGAEPVALAPDRQGNICVTGSSFSTAAGTRLHTARYRSDGTLDWLTTTERPDSLRPLNPPTCIGCDDAGAVYIAGSIDTMASFYEDMLVIKYGANGSEQWRRRYDGPGRRFDEARVLAVDRQGNCVVSGYSWHQSTGYDIVTVKYAPGGDTLWTRRYAGPGGLDNEDEPTAILTDDAGNVYLAGRSWADSSMDYVTIKYSAGGAEQWVARYNAPGNHTDIPRALALDEAGNVYVTGQAWNPGTLWDMVTVSYTPAGAQRWVAELDADRYYDEAYGLVVAGVNHFYITGGSAYTGTGYDLVTVGYGVPTAVAEGDPPATRPVRARPNPATETVRFQLRPENRERRLTISDALGRQVRAVLLAPGADGLDWDCRDERGRAVPAGVYWLRSADAPADPGHRVVVAR